MKKETKTKTKKKREKPFDWCIGYITLEGPADNYLISLKHGCWAPVAIIDQMQMNLLDFSEFYNGEFQYFGRRPSKEKRHEILIDAWLFACIYYGELGIKNKKEIKKLRLEVKRFKDFVADNSHIAA